MRDLIADWGPQVLALMVVGALGLLVVIGGKKPSPTSAELRALEARVVALETATPPTCVQVYPDKLQIDIYPAANLGVGPRVRRSP